MMKKRSLVLFYFFLLLLAFAQSNAIGISPSEITVPFTPQQEVNFSLFLLNTGSLPLNVTLSFNGDFASSLSLLDEEFHYLEPSSTKKIDLTLHLPLKVPPGKNTIELLAREVPLGDVSQGFSAYGTISSLLHIVSPYPGTYATLTLEGHDANINQSLSVDVTAHNQGKNSIKNMVIVVTTSSPDTVFETLTKTIPRLEPGTASTLPFSLDASLYAPGTYTATAYARYHSFDTEEYQTHFRVGHLYVNITRAEITPYPEHIFKLFLEVESFWNAPLDNVYALLSIKNAAGETLHTVTTPAVSLTGWGKQTLSSFFDGNMLAPDTYTADITLFYQDSSTHVTLPLHMEEPSSPNSYGSALIFIIILLIFNYFWLRKKNKPSSKYEDTDYKL